MNNKKEIWAPILGYEGLYEVSTFGNIKRLSKKEGNGVGYLTKEYILKKRYDKDGYINVVLYKNSKPKYFRTHRIVAITFIENKDNLPLINHKDEDKSNNDFENLEWCTNIYNLNYGSRNKRISISKNKNV